MAWIGLDLDETLVQKQPVMPDPEMAEGSESGEEQEEDVPTDGAVDFVNQLVQQGHRLTVFTARFKAMPDSEKQRLKEQIEQELAGMGFPELEVWTGTHKPEFDLYVGNEAITYDGDFPLVLAQLQYMLGERGLDPTQEDPNAQDPTETPDEAPVEEA